MSKTNNLLTKYFRKTKKNVNSEPTTQVTLPTDEQEKKEIENESPSSKRLKLSENKGLSTSTSPTCSRALASLTISTSSPPPTTSLTLPINSTPPTCSSTSTCSTSPNERDPCLGQAAAKPFVFLGPYQPDSRFPTVDNRHFCRQWYSMHPRLEYSEMYNRAFCFVCRLSYGTGKIDTWFTITGFNTWKNAITRFSRHQSSIAHKEALQTWEDIKKKP